MNLEEIKTGLRDRVEELALHLFPMGKKHGAEWTIGDVAGNPSRKPTGIGSLGVHLHGEKQGVWADHATGETGTLLDLWAMHYGFHGVDGWVVRAGVECASWLGGTFDKKRPDAPTTTRNGAHPKPARAMPPKSLPKLPAYTAEWDTAVERLNDDTAGVIASSRGFSLAFCQWLRSQKLIGVIERRGWKNAIALPVHDEQGTVIAAHVRNASTHPDGSPITPPPPKWQYLYHGDTSPGTRLLIIGDVKKASKLWVFESQWDAFAVIDRMGLHTAPEWPAIAILITRGASNARLLQPYAGEGKTLILWPQNDQPDPRTGKIPAEEWVKGILEVASGSMPIRRVNTPKEYEDPNAWLKACPLPDGDADSEATAQAVTPQKILEAITQALPARETKLPALRDMAFAIRPENRRPKPPEIVKGLLHRGSKLIIGGTSKGRKSWSLLDLALSVATGQPWWGFDTVKGRVLYINFEIQEAFFEERVEIVVTAKESKLQSGSFLSMTLRGHGGKIESLADSIIQFILDMEPFELIILDPVYKLMADRDENKVGDVTAVLNQIERIAVQTGAAIAIGAHFSKGNQAGKEAIDRIGGSGAFARDPDAILIMTQHEEDTAFTVECILRNFPPTDPFVVRWNFPLFSRDATLDPAALRMPRRPGSASSGFPRNRADKLAGLPNVRKNSKLESAIQFLPVLFGPLPRISSWGDMLEKIEVAAVPNGTAKRYLWALRDAGYIKKGNSRGTWMTDENGDKYLDERDSQKPSDGQNSEP